MTVETMVDQAESMLGVVGRPNKATRWYASRNGSYFADAAWCSMFLTWAAYHSGNYQPVCFGADYAYTVFHAQRFQRAGQWHVATAGIRRGDVVFFDWAGTGSVAHIDHAGLVTAVKGKDVHTIEANSSNRCVRRVRRADTVVGYGRPLYAEPVPRSPVLTDVPWVSYRRVRAAAAARGGVAVISGASSKPDVLLFQRALASVVGVGGLDYSSGPGYYGPRTRAAAKRYQETQWPGSSMNDGIIGPEMIKRLAADSKLFQVRDL